VWRFNRLERPKVVAALARHGAHLEPVVFRGDGDARRFLRGLSG
jgi:hypothetical protein